MMRFNTIRFYSYEAPFKHPIKTPKVNLNSRKVLVIELVNEAGTSYFGEANAFETDWYDKETIKSVYTSIKDWFYHHLKGQDITDFEEAAVYLNALDAAPTARSTAAMALFQAFHTLPAFDVAYGATISGLSEDNYQQLLSTQPKRVKLKWSQHVLEDLKQLQALPFQPELALDANESLTEQDSETLKQVHAAADLLYIEEPFKDLNILKAIDSAQIPPVALDEKARDLETILKYVQDYPIDTVVLKPFRLGGIDKVLTAIEKLEHYNIKVVIGGMYEYGLSRYFTAYLSRFTEYPGDVTPYGYYFEQEFVSKNGILKEGHIHFVPPEVNVQLLNAYE